MKLRLGMPIFLVQYLVPFCSKNEEKRLVLYDSSLEGDDGDSPDDLSLCLSLGQGGIPNKGSCVFLDLYDEVWQLGCHVCTAIIDGTEIVLGTCRRCNRYS
jgi:hypothetical protein